jgi:hypothetical protein
MTERQLNYYFNKGKFNHPIEIGYVMNEIRKCAPVTLNEWRKYYLENVRESSFLDKLACRMYDSIEIQNRFETYKDECLNYIHDVIFRRTFLGYNKENLALKMLNLVLSNKVELSPKEWDGEYFIDFVIKEPLIGIQLKPETFYHGKYDFFVNIDERLRKFEREFKAKTFTLVYSKSNLDGIKIINEGIINEIKNYVLKNG